GAWVDWQLGVTDTSADFVGQDGRFYEFEARGVDNVGNEESFTGSPEAWTTTDTKPPLSTVNPFPNSPISSTTFTVAWTGDDGGGSGIAYYDVQYRYNGGGWVLWQDQTTATSAVFDASVTGDGGYDFEVRAVDNLGRVEMFLDEPEASIIVDTQPPFVEPRLWLPLAQR
ncbi:MAG: hypothetical protein ACP5GX_09975, partial [Anaerolineae bacterium]